MSKLKVSVNVQVSKNTDDSYSARIKSSLRNEQITIKKAESIEEIVKKVQDILEEADNEGKIGDTK